MRVKWFKYSVMIAGIALAGFTGHGQSKGIEAITKAIGEKDFPKANTILQSAINEYASQPDSMVNYVFYVGKVNQLNEGAPGAIKKVQSFVEKIKQLTSRPATLRQALIEAGEYYGSIGKNHEGYAANEEAYKYTLLLPSKKGSDVGLVQNNLATFAQRIGDLGLSQQHTRRALQHLLADKNPNYETLYISYNGMGATMWYGSKTDSAMYYFKKALEALDKAPPTPVNQYYRPATINNNISALYQADGNTTMALEALKTTINNLKLFIASPEPDNKKVSAVTFQFEATDNLAGIYKELGDMRRARELLEYSYQQKQQHLTATDPGIFISEILLGQLYFATHNYDKSLQFLKSGLQKIAENDGDYNFWRADASNTLALLHDARGQVTEATYYFELADSLYEVSLQGEYDNIYLDFLRNAALFYAESGQTNTAISKANKGYNYVIQSQGPETLIAFYQLLNQSEVYYLSGKFKESLDYSKRGLEVVNRKISSSENMLDSIRMELKKPKAILQKGKAAYELLENKNAANLTQLLDEMNAALVILERQKTILSDPQDIGLLVSDHSGLLDFIKKLNLELYGLTKNSQYINSLVSLHESGIYNRIRSRLDKNDSIQFARVSGNILSAERSLKTAIRQALEGKGTYEEKMQRYLQAVEKREQFNERLKTEHPRYYNLRYASIFKSLGEITQIIPPNTTLIRYFFADKNLFALVADNKQKAIFPLEADELENNITSLTTNGMNVDKTAPLLYLLQQQLWAPLIKNIHHKKVIIIPDGILHNLNFEILTPTKIKTFRELATKSLLADFTISYHYSLFLLQQKPAANLKGKSFVAFAPGFYDELKNNYRLAAKDSSDTDKGYLSLLPQPFSIRLAVKARDLLGGKAFIHEESTKNSFRQMAGNNKIIHIGTHAESNNDHPEFSRLIFAKNTANIEEENSLFVDEIYNINLNANLTVLTACESGKPGYQDGEGMISLAHAFNYAGSESILTGLWKIDEQASAILMDHFYQNLLKGMPKDESLRQAKLTYLANAEGRMLAPQYWAGLVIMGDTSPIAIEPNNTTNQWLIAGGILFVSTTGLFLYRRSRKRKFTGNTA